MSLNINEWDFKTMPKYPVIVNISKRRGGKSFLTRDLIRNHFWANRKVKNVMVISETALFNGDYYFLKKERITPHFTESLITDILDRQKKLIEWRRLDEVVSNYYHDYSHFRDISKYQLF